MPLSKKRFVSYFRPPRSFKVDETRKWTDKERELLIQGIQTHGIGNFGKISDELLQKWVGRVHRFLS